MWFTVIICDSWVVKLGCAMCPKRKCFARGVCEWRILEGIFRSMLFPVLILLWVWLCRCVVLTTVFFDLTTERMTSRQHVISFQGAYLTHFLNVGTSQNHNVILCHCTNHELQIAKITSLRSQFFMWAPEFVDDFRARTWKKNYLKCKKTFMLIIIICLVGWS